MADKVLIWNTESESYFSELKIADKELSDAALVERDVAKVYFKKHPHINIIELEDAFTSLQIECKMKK